MSIGIFANQSLSACTAPLLDETKFGKTGGYQAGRYCGLGTFEVGATEQSCCFPCPMQDWVYPPAADWRSYLRIPNYLSIFSVILCSFLLLSFIVLPPAQSHRHYLSIGLLIPVLLISLSFAIPVSTSPEYCYDAITPSDMHDSDSCAWTGSLITLGGLGCMIWVFLRSLWLFLRIVYDVAPGRKFMLGSIAVGTLLPVGFLAAVLAKTGFSYRMGSTCLPNHENAISTFWTWLVVFAILGFLLQAVTTAYCFWIYTGMLRRVRSTPEHARGYGRSREEGTNMQTWTNIKKLFLLQWRNILVSVFVLVGSLVFFIVFWTQDSRLGRVVNDSTNIKPVKTWILCQVLSKGDKKECRKYVKDFTVDEPTVVTALILASLVGIEIFILLFRPSMLRAWIDLFERLSHRAGITRAPTPELTSVDNTEVFSLTSSAARKSGSKFVEDLEATESSKTSTTHKISNVTHISYSDPDTILRSPPLHPPPKSANRNFPPRPCQSSAPALSLFPSSPFPRSPPTIRISPPSNLQTSSLPYVRRNRNSSTYHPSRPVPTPPAHISDYASAPISPISVKSSWTERSWRDSAISALEKVGGEEEEIGKSTSGNGRLKKGAGKLMISGPVEGSFRHVDGTFVGKGKERAEPFVFGDRWDDDDGDEGGRDEGKRIGIAS
ncbi:hypothetical protein IQ06DRAFT_370145 [Phaeosphaeriaceae sp. SRC1lsM3a]|nr:hypothetical protein IQ06DRAFT_370145 [Stagonospora sp. SRC1lsM3a]